MNNTICKLSRNTIALLLFFLSTAIVNVHGQANLSATASSGSGYPVITAAGYAEEDPDCVHSTFGPHVTMASDAQLGKNVFVFHSHIIDDNDRCTNFDRVRMEIKGWNGTTEHTQGQTAYYRWKFKLDANFIGGTSFCHIFQIKAKTGDAGAPIITITPRKDILEVIHDGGDDGTGTDLGRLTSVPLAPFKGTWVEAYVKYTSSDNGSFEIVLKKVSDGTTLLSYSKTSGIDMWRTGDDQVNRGKWGVYRSKNSTGLRDEQVRFADFCVSESSASQCPSSIGSTPPTGSFSGFYRLTPRHSGKALVVQSASTANSAAVVQYTYGGSNTNDEWELVSIGSGYYRIINRNSGKDMVVQSASTADGGAIIQYTYGGSNTNDEWQIIDVGGGYYEIVNRNSSKAVEVAGSSTSDGAAVNQRTYSGGTNQQFQLVSIGSAAKGMEEVMSFQNPVSDVTPIQLKIVKGGKALLALYDNTGRQTKVLLNKHLQEGSHTILLQSNDLAAGIYSLQLRMNGRTNTKQLVKM